MTSELKRSLTVGGLNVATMYALDLSGTVEFTPLTFPLVGLVILTAVLWSLTLRMLFGRPGDNDDV